MFGTLAAGAQVFATGGQITHGLRERLNRSRRQQVAAMGRRVTTRCTHEAGVREPWALYQVYANVGWPHAVSACHGDRFSRPTGRAQPRQGGRGPQRWPRG